jgi:hypothetical protein
VIDPKCSSLKFEGQQSLGLAIILIIYCKKEADPCTGLCAEPLWPAAMPVRDRSEPNQIHSGLPEAVNFTLKVIRSGPKLSL